LQTISPKVSGDKVRPEFHIPQIDRERLEDIAGRTDLISDMLERREDATGHIESFNQLAGHDYGPDWFAHYWESRDLEAALPPPARTASITRDELVWLVRQIQRADRHSGYYLRLLQANVTDPNASNLIFRPPPGFEDATAEQIVDKALSYRPIACRACPASRLARPVAGRKLRHFPITE